MKSKLLLSILLAAVTSASLLVALAEPIRAAFPGENGKVVFVSDRGGSWGGNIYTMNPDGLDLTQLTSNPEYEADFDPVWSPEGTKIAFTHEKNSVEEHVYVMNADGSEQTKLARGFAPTWSPDGDKIAFASYRNGEYAVNVMNADGSKAKRLTGKAGDSRSSLSWSPDGKKIAFASCPKKDKPWGIFVINADGAEPTRLTNADPSQDCGSPYATIDGSPSWSPDGSKITFDRYAYRSSGQVFVMNADGTKQTNLGRGGSPAWSPDGEKIVYNSDPGLSPDGDKEIIAMNPDGTAQTSLTDNTDADYQPDWGVAPGSARGCTITGTEDGETLRGTPGPDVICGLDGDDTIRGLGSDDTIYGDDGDDMLVGGRDADRIFGGSGRDTFRGGPGRDACKADRGEAVKDCP